MPSAPKVTKADFDKWKKLNEKRLKLQREAKDTAALMEPIEAKFEEYVRAKEPATLSVSTCGFVLAIKTLAGLVKWKDEFIRAKGIKAAEKLIAKMPSRESLSIEPIQ